MATIDTLNELTIACAKDLFGGCGVPLDIEAPNAPSERHELASVIGFTGNEMKGTLILTATSSCVQRAHPSAATGTTLSDADLRDWMGELANQLLGRIKSSLLRHDVVLIMSTPVALSGDQLQWARPSSPTSTRHHLRGPIGSVTACFDALIAPGFQLSANPAPEAVGASTGDLLFL